jgi:hypothetical protein
MIPVFPGENEQQVSRCSLSDDFGDARHHFGSGSSKQYLETMQWLRVQFRTTTGNIAGIGALRPSATGGRRQGHLALIGRTGREVTLDQDLEIALSNCDPERSRRPPHDGLRELPPDFELHHVFEIDF